tara:strand:- start:1459 stop:2055 length:597 start_codon:yes stop_codon:yes gene_type:complete
MADASTTNLDDLPLSPQNDGNIQLETKEMNVKIDNPAQELQTTRETDPEAKQKNMNQLVNGIQQASAAGMLGLPARDIPQTQTHLTQDVQMQPNFVPEAPSDYIQEHQTSEDIIRANAHRQEKEDSLDLLYAQLQTPILIGVMYFIFQLPVVRKNVFKFMPALFGKDGNPNLSGYVVNSVAFASLYFLMVRGIKYFSI